MKSNRFGHFIATLNTSLLLATVSHGEAPATTSEESKTSKQAIVIGPYKPVGRTYDPTTGAGIQSHNPLLDQHIGKLVTVQGELRYGKVFMIGNVTVHINPGTDPEYIRSLGGKQVECTGVLVKSIVKHQGEVALVQAEAGTHYILEDNGPIKPVGQTKPQKNARPENRTGAE